MTWSSPTQWGLLPCKHAVCMRSKSASPPCAAPLLHVPLGWSLGIQLFSFVPLPSSDFFSSRMDGCSRTLSYVSETPLVDSSWQLEMFYLSACHVLNAVEVEQNALGPVGTCSNKLTVLAPTTPTVWLLCPCSSRSVDTSRSLGLSGVGLELLVILGSPYVSFFIFFLSWATGKLLCKPHACGWVSTVEVSGWIFLLRTGLCRISSHFWPQITDLLAGSGAFLALQQICLGNSTIYCRDAVTECHLKLTLQTLISVMGESSVTLT